MLEAVKFISVLSDIDFDDLISLDRKDMRRHMYLAVCITFFGVLIILLGSLAPVAKEAALATDTAAKSFPDFFGKQGLLGQLAGSAVTLLSGPSINKYLKVRRNIDRLELLRRRWKRLLETGETKADVSYIWSLLKEAMK